MKKLFMFCLILLVILCACQKVEWIFIEESVLEKAEYQKGNFSVSSYWTLTFESGTVLVQSALKNQAFFIGKTYEIYYRGETSTSFGRYKAILK